LWRVELYEDKLVIHYVAPIVPQATGGKVGYGLHSDRGDFHSTLIQVVPVAAAEIDFQRPNRGRGIKRPRVVSGARDYRGK